MISKVVNWFCLISVIAISLLGFRIYFTSISFLSTFLIGIFTVIYLAFDKRKILTEDLDTLDDPLRQTNSCVQLPKVIEIFLKEPKNEKFDNRITGSDTVDTFLNDIITIIINDFVTPWYEVITNDNELTTQAIRKLVLAAGVNICNRIKYVDWIHILSTRVPEELTTHLKLFKQSRVKLKHIDLLNTKEMANGNFKYSPEKKIKRNKSETDLTWPYDSTTYGKSKFYDSTENVCSTSSTLKDIFFDLECSYENRQLCRDVFCLDPEKEYALLSEVSEAILYLIAPEEVWKCTSMKLMLIELLSAVVFKPLINLLSDPDNINRTIIKMCCRDNTLPVELFLTVLRASTDAEELDATLELVHKDIQKLHSKDSAGEWDLQDRQKLSSLQYLTRIIQARRATLGPQEGLSNTTDVPEKISEEVTRTLKFLSETTSWRSNAQYCLEIELLSDNTDSPHTCKTVIDSLRSSALELCDTYLASNRPSLLGVPENYYTELVRKITTDGEEFTNNPVTCFDDLQKFCYDALEDDPSWQSDYMMENGNDPDKAASDNKKEEKLDRKYSGKCKKIMKTCFANLPKLFKQKLKCGNVFSAHKASTFPRSMNRKTPSNKNHTLPKCNTSGDTLQVPGVPRHNRSRSDIVGNTTQKFIHESAGTSNLATAATSNLSMSHSDVRRSPRTGMGPLSASIIETALVQDKGKSFGIYAVAVTRLTDNEEWHIYRRYSDFHDLHSLVKDKWPELGDLPFPAKKAFQNTSRTVLETRKRILNSYLQTLTCLARDQRYAALWSQEYLGGFLSPENQSGKHSNFIDVIFVNSLRAGMRTLKNMPDQFVNTVDGVMDGISKVFQGKSDTNFDLKTGSNSDCAEDGGYESVALRLLEEVLGIRGLWLRRRLLAPLRTIIADRVNKKVYELVASLTSPRNVVQYLKTFKQWLVTRGDQSYNNRDPAIRARARVTAKVALLSACSDDLRHIVGSDTAKRGLLTFFDLFQTQEINKRLIYVLLEDILSELFPDNNIPQLFKKIYTNSARVPAKKSVNI